VNGESTTGRPPFSERDAPDPRDPYGLSKWEAELALAEIAAVTGLETVAVRPPLVHGPGVGGNLLRLLRLVDRGIPLPFAGVANHRTLIAADNLADLLALCVDHSAAAGRTFTVGDGEDLSTGQLISTLAAGMGRSAHLVPAPQGLLRVVASAFGKGAALDRLTGSLQVDSTTIRELLDWRPPVTAVAGLTRMAHWYREDGGRT
jgi:nucleoside-diphosphate-sugar epimerase